MPQNIDPAEVATELDHRVDGNGRRNRIDRGKRHHHHEPTCSAGDYADKGGEEGKCHECEENDGVGIGDAQERLFHAEDLIG